MMPGPAPSAGGCGDEAFVGNAFHRAMFTLPPIPASSGTALAVPSLPEKKVVTGDNEVDAVLWLREVIGTGQAVLIAKAMEAADLVKTPMAVLEKRYRDHLTGTDPGNMFAAMASFSFGDLDELARRSIEKLANQHEGKARFGDQLFKDTPAEKFSIKALKGLKRSKGTLAFDGLEVAARFSAAPELLPHTLADCLHELAYWHDLYRLRHAVAGIGDASEQAHARDWFVFGLLASIPPRSREEASAALEYLIGSDRMDMEERDGILRNLVCGVPASPTESCGATESCGRNIKKAGATFWCQVGFHDGGLHPGFQGNGQKLPAKLPANSDPNRGDYTRS